MNTNHQFKIFWLMTKLQRFLISLVWRLVMLVYFGAGIGAFGVLFLIEAEFFIQVTQHLLLGCLIAGIFEVVKVGTSVIKQAMTIANRSNHVVCRMRVSGLIQGISALFHAALMFVSMFCSVTVVTSYLDGSAFNSEATLLRQATRTVRHYQRQPIVETTLAMIEEGLHLDLNPAIFISGFAVLLSALFQGTVYIVFGHLVAIHAREIEHIFEVKMHRMDAKKNSTTSD
jgi:hypothetical protein